MESVSASPLGRYSELAATIVALAVTGAWIVVHLGAVATTDTQAIDTAATLVVGVVLGQRATTNGAGKIAAAAHERIDVLESQVGVITHPPAASGGA